MNYILDLEKRLNIKLSGEWQHGFQRGRGTHTALLTLQTKMAKKLQQNKYVGLYTLDLSAAFDTLDSDCFRERLTSRGFPDHLINILYDFLQRREQYVSIEDCVSEIKRVKLGCV